MEGQRRDLLESVKSFAVGILLIALVFVIPDAGQAEHKSFFAVATQSLWSHPFDWPSVWCSAKIILLAIAGLMILNAAMSLLLNSEYEMICAALFMAAIFPLLLGFFGFYELAKAIL